MAVRKHDAAVTIALIAALGGWGTALISNWDKFSPAEAPDIAPPPSTLGDLPNNMLQQIIKLEGERASLSERLSNFSDVEANKVYKDIQDKEAQLAPLRGALRYLYATIFLDRSNAMTLEAEKKSGTEQVELERRALASKVAYKLLVMDHPSAPDLTALAQAHLIAKKTGKPVDMSDPRLQFKKIEMNDPLVTGEAVSALQAVLKAGGK